MSNFDPELQDTIGDLPELAQPNQSELERKIKNSLIDYGHALVVSNGELQPIIDQLFAYITANYTANTKLKALIKASEKLNLEFHGRPDCKNCALQEQLAELTKAKENV